MNKGKKVNYNITAGGGFEIENYNWSKSFASFFPGIAGKTGIPMWTYYVNRNQAVCSMGIKNKDHPIMEFLSFNKAVQCIPRQGYRTFIRIDGGKPYEPFVKSTGASLKQKMTVYSHELSIEDINTEREIETTVTYFQLPGENIPAFVRKVSVKNLSSSRRQVEVIDGHARFLPYGVDREGTNVIPRHIEGLMKVYNAAGLPFFKLKIDPEDKPQIELLKGGNFYFTCMEDEGLVKNSYITDPYVVFGSSKNYDSPYMFAKKGIGEILTEKQVNKNKTPCAMTPAVKKLKGGEKFSFYSVTGFVNDKNLLGEFTYRADGEYLEKKRRQNKNTISSVKDRMFTLSAWDNFNSYCGQTFLDNVIRGGMPVPITTAAGKDAFYVYSRQNGDLERDYHDFVLDPTYYSQGNAHYRCIIQNRRSDNFFTPEIGESNIRLFLNAMQTDGYNPIEVKKSTFSVTDKEKLLKYIHKIKQNNIKEVIKEITQNAFTPGDMLMKLEKADPDVDGEKILKDILKFSRQNVVIDLHGRLGYWLDHWCYNLDLIQSYLRIYPEKKKEMLLKGGYTFYDSPDRVLERDKKYILLDGKVRQYEAVERDMKRLKEIRARKTDPTAVRTKHGKGEIYSTTLAVKLLSLIANRLATLDAENLGVEMEANKPGWNDSINGLPGILGSSICHSIQLRRHCEFLAGALENVDKKEIRMFKELHHFISKLKILLAERVSDGNHSAKFRFWDKSHRLKEEYRKKTDAGVDGGEKEMKKGEIVQFLELSIKLLDEIFSPQNREKVFNDDGIPYTYFINDAVSWEKTGKKDSCGRDFVRVKEFSQRPAPAFLEGPVHMMKVYPEKSPGIYENIKSSPLYDKKLKSYRNNYSLREESYEIGRIKAWGRGWIENESLYTHMLFKYLLEVLNSGLYRAFYDDLQNSLMPFMDPQVYGRSIFENVSFIVSSAFADEKLHGQGLQARLSGSTCEFISMWGVMCAGEKPFFTDGRGRLKLQLQPRLPEWLFTEKRKSAMLHREDSPPQRVEIPQNSFAFLFLGKTLVVYHNPMRKDTFEEARPLYYTFIYRSGREEKVKGPVAGASQARALREGKVERVEVELG